MAHWLASELFADYDSPMPAFTLMGKEGEALLDSALALPRQTAGGKPAYPSLFDKAAVLFRSLMKNHPFVDGNKRMAVMAMAVFLFINGHLLWVRPNDLVELARIVADSPNPSLPTLSQGLRKLSVKWEGPWTDFIIRKAREERSGADWSQALAKTLADIYHQQKA